MAAGPRSNLHLELKPPNPGQQDHGLPNHPTMKAAFYHAQWLVVRKKVV